MALTVRDVMQRDVVTVAEDTPLLVAQHLLVAAAIGAAPVVDATGRVVGVLTAQDVLRALDEALDQDDDRAGEPAATAGDELAGVTAGMVASPDVAWAAPEEDVAVLAARMHQGGLHRVLVGDGRVLAGLVTTFDLLIAVRGE